MRIVTFVFVSNSDDNDTAVEEARSAIQNPSFVPMSVAVDDGMCPGPNCGKELQWDAGERMYFCPDDWKHG